MDREERAQIRRMVLECRRILESELDELLRLHGLLSDRKISVPSDRQETRSVIEEALNRESGDYAEARRRYLKHAAFTLLNRFLALRVSEATGLIKETVLTRPEYGDRSRRERDLADADPNLAVQPERLAHEALREAFAEMEEQIPILFRSTDPYALLLPRLPAYRELRRVLEEVPERLWNEYETLGWAYQFFNSEEREEIRRRLRRNPKPDDIPPINQFYTVGWIVKFLVHNTLGRLWLERHPGSSLRHELDYLVPVRNDFRSPEGFPPSVSEWKVLDPACGSGHFLLGSFDLLLKMWREERPESPPWRIPSLILERNLYGVDIDLRACQIAATALYLKARKAFEDLRGDDPDARFELKRINIVCADIRFVDGERREEFLDRFDYDPALRRIADETLKACENAYELGSLLQIRQPFERLFERRRISVEEFKRREKQLFLFPEPERQLTLGDQKITPPKEMTVDEIVEKIKDFVGQAAERKDMGSLFFGLDAEQAVHLVEVLSDSYEIVLMNPPYGAMPSTCKEYARKHYPRTHSDYYAAFIEQAIELTKSGGYVGALTGRTFLFLKSFQKLREEILRGDALMEVLLDLGFNVLDEATARYAAFTLRKRHDNDGVDWSEHPVTCFRLTKWDWDEKRIKFEEALSEYKAGEGD
ncbi:hypothetical protein J7M22_09740 [Candidatus Poribacteria bacterium]|nr:hypothetical protein [Candidatus Poribacteria bacterium]